VIGVTASALKGDREICIAAGMDDYLAKPFRRDALRAVLERWVFDQLPAGAAAAALADGPALETFDGSTLAQMCANHSSAAPRIVASLIDHYVLDAGTLIDALVSAAAHGDDAALAHTAHLLRTGSEFVGARKLAAMCVELEQAALGGEVQDVSERIATIRQEYGAVRLAVEAVRSRG